eukprot:2764153-Ditylum_brightwellii.AAC.1
MPAAQTSAYTGNGSGALKLLIDSALLALYNNTHYETVLNLYPPGTPGTNPTVLNKEKHYTRKPKNYPEDQLLKYFSHIKTGKGFSPHSNIINIFRNLTLFKPAFSKNKHWPIDNPYDVKYQPIGTGTCFRRCLTAFTAKVENPSFAQTCLEPNNFRVGIRGRAQLVAFTLLT